MLLLLLLGVTFVVRSLTHRTTGGVHYTLVRIGYVARQCRTLWYSHSHSCSFVFRLFCPKKNCLLGFKTRTWYLVPGIFFMSCDERSNRILVYPNGFRIGTIRYLLGVRVLLCTLSVCALCFSELPLLL